MTVLDKCAEILQLAQRDHASNRVDKTIQLDLIALDRHNELSGLTRRRISVNQQVAPEGMLVLTEDIEMSERSTQRAELRMSTVD